MVLGRPSAHAYMHYGGPTQQREAHIQRATLRSPIRATSQPRLFGIGLVMYRRVYVTLRKTVPAQLEC